jgi:disulfide bond formation protein DsbB
MELIALFTLLAIISIGIFAFVLLMRYSFHINLFDYIPKTIINFSTSKSLWMGFLVALTATMGSLYFSELQGFAPCDLCWYQRVFMYPLTFMLLIAAIKKDTSSVAYVLPIAGIGFLLAAYHTYIQFIPVASIGCRVGEVSCTEDYVTYFGFINIPIMSLVSFALVMLSSLLPFIPLHSRK